MLQILQDSILVFSLFDDSETIKAVDDKELNEALELKRILLKNY